VLFPLHLFRRVNQNRPKTQEEDSGRRTVISHVCVSYFFSKSRKNFNNISSSLHLDYANKPSSIARLSALHFYRRPPLSPPLLCQTAMMHFSVFLVIAFCIDFSLFVSATI